MSEKDQYEALWLGRLMHVHAAEDNHEAVTIRCTRQALDRLARAFAEGQFHNGGSIEMIASDGEGYRLVIQVKTEAEMMADPLHYATQGHWYEFVPMAEHQAIVRERDALLAAQRGEGE